MFTIYLATCVDNDKVYVGQTNARLSKRRWAHTNRRDYGAFFHRAIRKYGPERFKWQVLGTVASKQEANNLERIWIILLQSKNRLFGYNLTAGGDGSVGHQQSEATRAKRSSAMKALWAAGKLKVGRGWKRSHPEETRNKIRATLALRPKIEKQVCAVPGCLRHTHSHGFCTIHAHRFKRYGNPVGGNPIGRTGPPKGCKYGPRKSRQMETE